MTADELLEQLKINLVRINTSERNFFMYDALIKSFQNIVIIDSFFQIKKNDKGDGLAFELMFFSEKSIYDIVITRSNIDYITVNMRSVSSSSIETNFGESKNEIGEQIVNDLLKFSITYGGDFRQLIYSTDTKRFEEINRLNINLHSILNL